jgi:anaerobic nitric oxide reductase flavorubredoxin
MNIPINMICPSHGIIWRDNPLQIVETYLKWAADYQENQIVIVYDTMWNGTRKMAEAIAEGIKEADKDVTVKLFNSAKRDKNDILTEIFKSKAFLIGSPTINKGLAHSIGGLLEMMRGLGFKNKKAASFGSYGWSGEGIKLITQALKEAGIATVDDGIRELWNPDDEAKERLKAYGKNFVEAIKA